MEVCHRLEDFAPPPQGTALTIGNFDGVHRGHAHIIAAVRAAAAPFGAPTVVMTFDPHPLAVLAPERAPARLTTGPEKLHLLAGCGVDRTLLIQPDPTFLAQEPDDFLASLVAHCRPRALIEGPDFNFGRGRAGTIDTLRRHAEQWGYTVHVAPVVRCGDLRTHPTISSTSIRQALRDGRVDEANAMFGRPYRVVGVTGHGQGRGATLGLPTVNLEAIPHVLPQEAVYAAAAQLESGQLCLAAVNIGPQPTFAQMRSRVEAHLLDFAGDLRGRPVGLHFFARLREQTRFASADELVAQIHADIAATRTFAQRVAELQGQGVAPL